jgi:hypothetical protein
MMLNLFVFLLLRSALWKNLVDRKRGGGVIKNPPRQNPGGIGSGLFSK